MIRIFNLSSHYLLSWGVVRRVIPPKKGEKGNEEENGTRIETAKK